MTKKSDSKWLSLATVPILGQPPSSVFSHCGINALQKSSTSQNNRVKIIAWQPFEQYSLGRLYFFRFLKAANFSYPEFRLIMDERAGRAVAKEKGLHVIGTAAIVGQAKNKG